MSEDIKSLADRIRLRQQPMSSGIKTLLTDEKKEEPKPEKKKEKKAGHVDGNIITQILSCKNEGDEMIHIRLNVKTHRKLIALLAAKVTIQKFSVFAIERMLEHPDVKAKLNEIKNNMD